MARRIAFVGLLGLGYAPRIFAQSPTRLEFEVATVKLNNECVHGVGREQHSPGRFGVECVSLREYIRGSYGRPNARPPVVLGGPRWVDTDHFDIVAKAAGETGLDEMYGPMMRALLEDRFQLKVHAETREMPVYTLTVEKGGAKLVRLKDGSCVPIDLAKVLMSPPTPNYCGRMTTKGSAFRTVEGYGTTLAEFTGRVFRDTLDRPVIDKTGLTGRFDIHLEFAREIAPFAAHDGPAPATQDAGPSLFTALQEQLGLRLSPGRGPVEVLVIDHVERPSGN